jgi:hypothetical protein
MSAKTITRYKARDAMSRAKIMYLEVDNKLLRDALDKLSVLLAEHGHMWSADDRKMYEDAIDPYPVAYCEKCSEFHEFP